MKGGERTATASTTRTAAILATALALSLVGFVGVSGAQASNGTCNWSEGIWACSYVSGGNWPKTTKLWFEAAGGENERSWRVNYAWDNNGGTVMKCAGFKSFDGGEIPQACNNVNGVFLSIPESRRPGWVYVVHHAEGPRDIYGTATSG